MSEDVSRIALLIDYEEIIAGLPSGRKFNAKKVLERVLDLGKVVFKRAYADWRSHDKAKLELHKLGFDLIETPKGQRSQKSNADIRMVVDAMEMVISKEHIDTFAVVTGDSDVTPLVAKLREYDKTVIGIACRSTASALLVTSCDEFIFYEQLAAVDVDEGQKRIAASQSVKGGRKLERRRAEALFLVVDTARSLLRQKDNVWASAVKQAIVRRHPSFTESFHGYPTFTALLREAVELELIEATRDQRTGNYLINGLGAKVAGAL
ncbi:MAG: NYN domain-containing protein [Planctomycetes bacterium]|nr:NYN domain-containing protein [Planctomycetota bacterium]